jgi:Ala-tRNA(Pro) deacylase
MPISTKLKDYLDTHHVKYVTITHSKAYTAQEIAAAVHTPGKEMAKSVIIKLDGEFAMAVLPASYKIDFALLAKAAGASKAELATEEEFENLFPECEVGAMPIFGNLYGLPVYVSESLTDDEEFVFNAGSHTQAFKLGYEDFQKLANPKVLRFSEHV